MMQPPSAPLQAATAKALRLPERHSALLPRHGPQQRGVTRKRAQITGPPKGAEGSGGALAPQLVVQDGPIPPHPSTELGTSHAG